jgi:hypothetical protein
MGYALDEPEPPNHQARHQRFSDQSAFHACIEPRKRSAGWRARWYEREGKGIF